MDVAQYLVYDKGTKICQRCFHKRYYRKKWTPQNKTRKYTIEDLRQHLEKEW